MSLFPLAFLAIIGIGPAASDISITTIKPHSVMRIVELFYYRSESDYGVYECHAENEIGTLEQHCQVELRLPGKSATLFTSDCLL